MRWAEALLLVAPFAIFLIWRRVSAGNGPSLPVLAATLAALLAFGAALAWFGIARRIGPSERYVPAKLVDGRVVSGHAAPR
jgi:MFS superfamily sulfate permease-like transporter